MTLESLLALALTVFIFSLKIGPGITMALSYSVAIGFRGLVAFLIGFNISLALYLTVVFIGLETFNIDIVFLTILAKSLAAVYLIWTGVKGLSSEDAGTPLEENTPQSFIEKIIAAAMLTLSNPLIIVFYASLLPVFVSPDVLTFDMIIVIMGLIMTIDSLGTIIYCVPVILFRKKIPQSISHYAKSISSVVLILIGLYIGYGAIGAADILSIK
jgi:threonine/homoserine/homoserine lactone efflux protein